MKLYDINETEYTIHRRYEDKSFFSFLVLGIANLRVGDILELTKYTYKKTYLKITVIRPRPNPNCSMTQIFATPCNGLELCEYIAEHHK